MTVKWVCSDCSSNNLHKLSPLMQCQVCGKIRTAEVLTNVDSKIVDTTGIKKKRIRLSGGRKRYLEVLYIFLSWYNTVIASACRIGLICFIACLSIYLYVSGTTPEEFFTYFTVNVGFFLDPDRYCAPLFMYLSLAEIHYTEMISAMVLNSRHIAASLIGPYIDNVLATRDIMIIRLENFCGNVKSLDILQMMDNQAENTMIVLSHVLQCCRILFTNLQFFGGRAVENVFRLKEQIIDKVRNVL